jgi:hypothetical protein
MRIFTSMTGGSQDRPPPERKHPETNNVSEIVIRAKQYDLKAWTTGATHDRRIEGTHLQTETCCNVQQVSSLSSPSFHVRETKGCIRRRVPVRTHSLWSAAARSSSKLGVALLRAIPAALFSRHESPQIRTRPSIRAG